MVTLGLELDNIERDELHFAHITTTPDNPYFQTGDISIVRRTKDWSQIKDGDFILVKNEVKEGFDDNMLRVTFNKENIKLTPLSSFVAFKEQEIDFENLDSIKLTGKLLGTIRGLSDELNVDAIGVF